MEDLRGPKLAMAGDELERLLGVALAQPDRAQDVLKVGEVLSRRS